MPDNMSDNNKIQDKHKIATLPLSEVIFKTVIAIFFGYGLSSILSGNMLHAIVDIVKTNDVPSNYLVTNPYAMKFRFSLIMGILISLPFVENFILLYKSPQQYVSEKKSLFLRVFVQYLLIIAGVAVLFYVYIPLLLGVVKVLIPPFHTSLPSFGIANNIFRLIIMIGFFVELPVIINILVRVRIIGSKQLSRLHKYTLILAFIVSAFLTPPDPVTMIMMAVLFIVMYEFSLRLLSWRYGM